MNLTSEQREFIDSALLGCNILVDACVGSGKTTAIQNLCNEYPTTKRILYLTYNKLLKVDAKEKIRNSNVTVTNYHGIAYMALASIGVKCGISDLIQTFNKHKPKMYHYDVLVLDEYQDIDLEISHMLEHIKNSNPGIQIVAVGDIKQKIYDKTTLDVMKFMNEFLGKYIDLEFTQCFRLGKEHAEWLSRVWGKKIIGVNNSAKISYMRPFDVVKFLKDKNPADVMCLGSRNGKMSNVLNSLEDKYSSKYNKKTVYASITNDGRSGKTEPSKDTAIFTTFDSSKGLERKICVVFDFTEDFWHTRINMPQQKYEILRNIFCVAASRGKEEIIFVVPEDNFAVQGEINKKGLLTEETLSTPVATKISYKDMQMSTMFDFKYKEDIEECFGLLETKKIERGNTEPIDIRTNDCLIDLSPCVGIYQEASYFKNYDIQEELELFRQTHTDTNVDMGKYKNRMDKQILYLTSLETGQKRYIRQVEGTIATKEQTALLKERLSEVFTPDEYEVQQECEMQFCDYFGKYIFTAAGIADVVKDDNIYELKFVESLQHEHYLQCAMYMVALKKEKGFLWNTRTNEMQMIIIPNRRKFMNAITKAVTKHQIEEYKAPAKEVAWKTTFRDENAIVEDKDGQMSFA